MYTYIYIYSNDFRFIHFVCVYVHLRASCGTTAGPAPEPRPPGDSSVMRERGPKIDVLDVCGGGRRLPPLTEATHRSQRKRSSPHTRRSPSRNWHQTLPASAGGGCADEFGSCGDGRWPRGCFGGCGRANSSVTEVTAFAAVARPLIATEISARTSTPRLASSSGSQSSSVKEAPPTPSPCSHEVETRVDGKLTFQKVHSTEVTVSSEPTGTQLATRTGCSRRRLPIGLQSKIGWWGVCEGLACELTFRPGIRPPLKLTCRHASHCYIESPRSVAPDPRLGRSGWGGSGRARRGVNPQPRSTHFRGAHRMVISFIEPAVHHASGRRCWRQCRRVRGHGDTHRARRLRQPHSSCSTTAFPAVCEPSASAAWDCEAADSCLGAGRARVGLR